MTNRRTRMMRIIASLLVLGSAAAGFGLVTRSADAAGFNLGLGASYSNGRVSLSAGATAGYVEIRKYTTTNTSTGPSTRVTGCPAWTASQGRVAPCSGTTNFGINVTLANGTYSAYVNGNNGYFYKTNFTVNTTVPSNGTCNGKAVTIKGTYGPDDIRGTAGNDVIDAGGGHDIVHGGGGNDTICGGAGNDKLWGGPGNDHLDGGTQNQDLCRDKNGITTRANCEKT
jgi:Ca2+-binding RTX toxin-like protein